MPPFARVLIVVFLGVPGFALLVGGFIILIGVIVLMMAEDDFLWTNGLLPMALSGIAAGIGFLMVTAAKLLTGSSSLRIPGRHVPAMVCYEMAIFLFGILSFISSLGTMVLLVFQLLNWRWPLLALVSIPTLIVVMRFQKSSRAKWDAEIAAEGLLPEGSAGAGT